MLVAIVSFVAGMMLGRLGAVRGGGSRIEWPKSPVPHPRSLEPYPEYKHVAP